jgi:predicted transcriptional regulator
MSIELEETDQIAMLEASPSEAVSYLRDLLKQDDPGGPAKIYDVWSAVTWKLLTKRLYGADAEGWYDAARQISGLLLERNSDFSQRVRGHADLLLESCRFGMVHSAEAMSSREHVRRVISIIDDIVQSGREAWRDDIRQRSQLKQSNLSRLLNNMEDAGLIIRKVTGKEVSVSLTEAGKHVLRPEGSDGGWTGKILEGAGGVEMRKSSAEARPKQAIY